MLLRAQYLGGGGGGEGGGGREKQWKVGGTGGAVGGGTAGGGGVPEAPESLCSNKTPIDTNTHMDTYTQAQSHTHTHTHTHTQSHTHTHTLQPTLTNQNFVVWHVWLFSHSLYGPSVHSLTCCQHTAVRCHQINQQTVYKNFIQKTCSETKTVPAKKSCIASNMSRRLNLYVRSSETKFVVTAESIQTI